MRVVSLRNGFGIGNLTLETREPPPCGPSQVLIRVRAVSLNYRDVMMVRGEYNPRQALPLVPCSDAAGEVTAIGSDVSEYAVGERVCPIFAPLWQKGPLTREAQRSALGGPRAGTLSEYIVAEANAIVRAPAHLSDVEAACLPCTFVTAYRALVEFGQIGAGNTVVCQGTGGVSLAALSIAKALGARVFITSSKAHKLERAQALGADALIDTSRTPDWAKAVRELSAGEGADHVIEVGGAQTLRDALRATRMGGSVSVIGVLSGAISELDVRPILMQELRVQGIFVGTRATFEGLLALLNEQRLQPQIDREFPLAEARAAFEYASSGQSFGKVVITLA